MDETTILILDPFGNDYAECYKSIRALYPEIKIIVINPSDLQDAKDKQLDVVMTNGDFTARKAVAISLVSTKYVVVIDNCSRVNAESNLELLINRVRKDYDVCGGQISFDGRVEFLYGTIHMDESIRISKEGGTDLVHFFYAIKSELLKAYIPNLGFYFFEDHLDDCIVWKEKGAKVCFEAECILFHREVDKELLRYNFRPFFKHIETKRGFKYSPIRPTISASADYKDLSSAVAPISVVVPCHNYGRFLRECLISIKAQYYEPAEIIVIDDSSSEDIEAICEEFSGIRFYRHEFRDVHQVRKAGLSYSTQKYICFLDADDKIPKEYFRESIRLFDEDYRTVITFPHLEYFGNKTGVAYATNLSPEIIFADSLEERNWIPSGSIFKKKILEDSRAFDRNIDPKKSWTQDWIIAREVLRSGPWVAKKMKYPLFYRSHGANMSSVDLNSYWDSANLYNETITMVIAFSGRIEAWQSVREWIINQSWPISQLRIMILDNSHTNISLLDLGLADWPGSIQIERCNLGMPMIAEKNRISDVSLQTEVNFIVSYLYNMATSISKSEYMFFLEDDVIPKSKDTIRQLLSLMSEDVAGVSGVYPTRYDKSKTCAWLSSASKDGLFMPVCGKGVEHIYGSGFGCLITRRSLLRKYPLSGYDGWYDYTFFDRCKNYRKLINYDVICDHLVK